MHINAARSHVSEAILLDQKYAPDALFRPLLELCLRGLLESMMTSEGGANSYTQSVYS